MALAIQASLECDGSFVEQRAMHGTDDPIEPSNGILHLRYKTGNYTLYRSLQAAIKIKRFRMYSFLSVQST